jgi:hypothetical protein
MKQFAGNGHFRALQMFTRYLLLALLVSCHPVDTGMGTDSTGSGTEAAPPMATAGSQTDDAASSSTGATGASTEEGNTPPVGTATQGELCSTHLDCGPRLVCVNPASGSECSMLGGRCERSVDCEGDRQCGFVRCQQDGVCQCYTCQGEDTNCITGDGCFGCQTDPG